MFVLLHKPNVLLPHLLNMTASAALRLLLLRSMLLGFSGKFVAYDLFNRERSAHNPANDIAINKPKASERGEAMEVDTPQKNGKKEEKKKDKKKGTFRTNLFCACANVFVQSKKNLHLPNHHQTQTLQKTTRRRKRRRRNQRRTKRRKRTTKKIRRERGILMEKRRKRRRQRKSHPVKVQAVQAKARTAIKRQL